MPGPNERRYSRNECGTGGDGEEGVAFMKLNLHCRPSRGYGNGVKTLISTFVPFGIDLRGRYFFASMPRGMNRPASITPLRTV